LQGKLTHFSTVGKPVLCFTVAGSQRCCSFHGTDFPLLKIQKKRQPLRQRLPFLLSCLFFDLIASAVRSVDAGRSSLLHGTMDIDRAAR
jgi:hypothetical protein